MSAASWSSSPPYHHQPTLERYVRTTVDFIGQHVGHLVDSGPPGARPLVYSNCCRLKPFAEAREVDPCMHAWEEMKVWFKLRSVSEIQFHKSSVMLCLKSPLAEVSTQTYPRIIMLVVSLANVIFPLYFVLVRIEFEYLDMDQVKT